MKINLLNVSCIINIGICKIPKIEKRILTWGNWKMVSISGKQCKEVVGERQKCLEPSYTGPCEPLAGVGIIYLFIYFFATELIEIYRLTHKLNLLKSFVCPILYFQNLHSCVCLFTHSPIHPFWVPNFNYQDSIQKIFISLSLIRLWSNGDWQIF